MKRKKVLYYNWVQFDNKEKQGGGVNVYLYNLIEKFIENPNYEIYFLSGGWKYNALVSNPYIKPTKNIFKDKCKTFEIINSPVIAPSLCTYMNLNYINSDDKSYQILKNFIKEHGPFDIIHFQNIEGLSYNVLKIKDICPKTKIIYSIHNYQAICPLVQYFQNHNKCVCKDYHKGEECLKCARVIPTKKDYINRCRNYLYGLFPNLLLKLLKVPINIISKSLGFRAKQYIGEISNLTAYDFVNYRTRNIKLINKYVDKVLAVSNRVKEIMIFHGINEKIIQTSYIGTKIAEKAKHNKLKYYDKPIFTIAYLGYANVDKGYFFMIDALSKIPKDITKRVDIVLAGKKITTKQLEILRPKYHNIKVYNNYSHEQLNEILKDVDLGIIPVIWEDNLPQVAIEMVACGIPILCSNLGGASELCRDNKFKFEGANSEDFITKLVSFIKEPNLLNSYWQSNVKLVTMDNHLLELEKIYGMTSDKEDRK